MNVNELRIGNLVKYHGIEWVVHSIRSSAPDKSERFNNVATIDIVGNDGIITARLDEVDPLSINMRRLSSLGLVEKYPLGEDFTVEEYTYRTDIKGNLEIEVNLSDSTFTLQNLIGISLIEYSGVHTLQNIYFALTGEELTI